MIIMKLKYTHVQVHSNRFRGFRVEHLWNDIAFPQPEVEILASTGNLYGKHSWEGCACAPKTLLISPPLFKSFQPHTPTVTSR